MSIFPNGSAWDNLSRAWNEVEVGKYFWNTVVLAIGSWLVQIVVATTGGFVLSVLQPAYARVLRGLLLLTLFVPAIVLLVPLYIEIVNPPLIDRSFVDTYWAIWLPAGASAFNVILVTRFFDNLPREVFEAAQIDGAGPFKMFTAIAAADVPPHPRGRLGLRRARVVEGLPLATARPLESRQAALVSAAARSSSPRPSSAYSWRQCSSRVSCRSPGSSSSSARSSGERGSEEPSRADA